MAARHRQQRRRRHCRTAAAAPGIARGSGYAAAQWRRRHRQVRQAVKVVKHVGDAAAAENRIAQGLPRGFHGIAPRLRASPPARRRVAENRSAGRRRAGWKCF